jgi:hypothetical protein
MKHKIKFVKISKPYIYNIYYFSQQSVINNYNNEINTFKKTTTKNTCNFYGIINNNI